MPKATTAKRSIVEPLFSGDDAAFDAPPIAELTDEQLARFLAGEMAEAAEGPAGMAESDREGIIPQVAPPAGALVWPTAPHYEGLTAEVSRDHQKGRQMLRRLFGAAFQTMYVSMPELVVDNDTSAWNEGETATYQVRVYNGTCFDVSDLRARLWISSASDGGSAAILNPPGSLVTVGDVAHSRWSDFAELKLRATSAGNVDLNLRFDGLIGEMRCRAYFNGRYWNQRKQSWDILPQFKQTHQIYPD